MEVNSPLTGNNKVTLLKSYSVQKVVQDWQEFFDIDITSEFKSYSDFHLYRCNVTGLHFFYPWDIFGSSHLYEKLMKFEWYYMADKWEYKIALQELKKNQRVLEIGCGHGHFVKQASKKGVQIKGIDSNEKATHDAQNEKLDVHFASIQDLITEEKSQYDCLCSFQVLEHLPNPLEFLSSCNQLLKSGGVLMLSVPNENSFLKYQYNILDMPPHHMTQWSINSFRSLESILPFKLENARCEPLAEYHISGYLEAKNTQFKKQLSQLPTSLVELILNGYGNFLRKGFNKYVKGQSLYVKFRKQ